MRNRASGIEGSAWRRRSGEDDESARKQASACHSDHAIHASAGDPRCDEETLSRRPEQWEDRRRTPTSGTPEPLFYFEPARCVHDNSGRHRRSVLKPLVDIGFVVVPPPFSIIVGCDIFQNASDIGIVDGAFRRPGSIFCGKYTLLRTTLSYRS